MIASSQLLYAHSVSFIQNRLIPAIVQNKIIISIALVATAAIGCLVIAIKKWRSANANHKTIENKAAETDIKTGLTKKSNEAILKVAEALFNQKKYVQAAEKYQEAYDLDYGDQIAKEGCRKAIKGYIDSLTETARDLSKEGKPDKAKAQYEKIVAIHQHLGIPTEGLFVDEEELKENVGKKSRKASLSTLDKTISPKGSNNALPTVKTTQGGGSFNPASNKPTKAQVEQSRTKQTSVDSNKSQDIPIPPPNPLAKFMRDSVRVLRRSNSKVRLTDEEKAKLELKSDGEKTPPRPPKITKPPKESDSEESEESFESPQQTPQPIRHTYSEAPDEDLMDVEIQQQNEPTQPNPTVSPGQNSTPPPAPPPPKPEIKLSSSPEGGNLSDSIAKQKGLLFKSGIDLETLDQKSVVAKVQLSTPLHNKIEEIRKRQALKSSNDSSSGDW